MSAIRYHQSALSLAKAAPSYSDKVAQQIASVTGALGIALPQAIVEWLCLDPEGCLFQHITQAPHYFLNPGDVPNHIVRHHFDGRETTAIELIFENQGCFVMAASLEEANDPSIWVSSDFHFCDNRQPTWSLQSHSFSDCIKAFAWDFNCIDRPDWRTHFRDIESVQELPVAQEYGPTTYFRSAWFEAREFRRLVVNDMPFTYLLYAL